MTQVGRDTVVRLIGGCAVAILLSGSAIVHGVVRRVPLFPPQTDDIYLSCDPCYQSYWEWWCEFAWGCPPEH